MIIAEELTKTNETLVIKHSEHLSHNIAYPFFLHQYAELMENGHTVKATNWDDNECGIIWGEIDGKVVGIFAYKKDQIKQKVLNILLTAVDKNHRNKGIHTILNRYFENVALDLDCKFTVATVHPKNQTRLLTCEKDGMKIYYHKLYKEIGSKD